MLTKRHLYMNVLRYFVEDQADTEAVTVSVKQGG